MLPTTKSCKACDTIKNISEFYKSNQTKDGLTYRCKACRALYVKEYRENNAQKMRESANKSYAKNKEKRNKYGKQYHKDNKEKVNKWVRQYYLDNKERIRDRNKKHHHDNKNNEDYIASKTNARHKRRALIITSSDGTVPINIFPLNKELRELLELQIFKCYSCSCDISDNKHLDHHVPLSKGGTHSIDNVVWLCPTCNLQKHAKIPDKLLLI